jgi:23S rRNA-/tRNA-specific pseudouridylate synthase
VQKTYEALIWGCPPSDSGLWQFPIARKGGESLLREVREDGQTAETRFRILRRFDACTHMELEPITGRTHQLRVHCAHRGFPILGDPQYGSEESKAYSDGLGLRYQRLCAKSVSFTHPITGEKLTITTRMTAEG